MIKKSAPLFILFTLLAAYWSTAQAIVIFNEHPRKLGVHVRLFAGDPQITVVDRVLHYGESIYWQASSKSHPKEIYMESILYPLPDLPQFRVRALLRNDGCILQLTEPEAFYYGEHVSTAIAQDPFTDCTPEMK